MLEHQIIGNYEDFKEQENQIEEKRQKEILVLNQRIRLEKEKDKRNREMDAARKKKK